MQRLNMGVRCGRARIAPVAFAVVLALSAPTLAVDFSKDSLDFFQGPLLNDGRVVGLGGAYVSIAEGVAGHLVNPAAFAVRPASFTNEWFDWDIGISTLKAVGGDIDLDMSGNDGRGDAAQAQRFGANLKFGRFGVGIHAVGQTHTLIVPTEATDAAPTTTTPATNTPATTHASWAVDQSYVGIGLAWAFADGDWVAGVLIGTSQATIASPRRGDPLVEFVTQLHPSTFGLLWAPRGERYRIGASFRSPQRMLQRAGARVKQLGALTIPESVQMPGQLTIGASWMFGDRQTNIRPTYGSGNYDICCVRTKALRRRYALVSADLLIIGSIHSGIGVRSYLEGKRQAAGEHALVGARLGAESEVLPNRLQIRTGTYFEPSRFANSVGRMHWTAGGDVRVSVYWDWRVNLMVDVAPQYRNVSAGIGLWH